jgi:hypothetical protein
MRKAQKITAWCQVDRSTSSARTVATAMERLRSRGGFGLTSLPSPYAIHQLEPGADTDGGLNSEILLPDPAGSGATMRFMPPGGLEAAAVKPAKVLELIQHPPEIDLRDAYDPGTSSLADLDEKRRELQYRKDWLEALLAVTQDELAAFDEARKQWLVKDGATALPAAAPQESSGLGPGRDSDAGTSQV